MSSERLSPAMRNVLFAVIRRGEGLPVVAHSHRIRQTLEALRERGLVDSENRPTAAGRAVFAPLVQDGAVRRPGMEAVVKRVRAERPNWTAQQVLAHAKHLYTNKGARC